MSAAILAKTSCLKFGTHCLAAQAPSHTVPRSATAMADEIGDDANPSVAPDVEGEDQGEVEGSGQAEEDVAGKEEAEKAQAKAKGKAKAKAKAKGKAKGKAKAKGKSTATTQPAASCLTGKRKQEEEEVPEGQAASSSGPLADDKDYPDGVEDSRPLTRKQRYIWEAYSHHLDETGVKAIKDIEEKKAPGFKLAVLKIKNAIITRETNPKDFANVEPRTSSVKKMIRGSCTEHRSVDNVGKYSEELDAVMGASVVQKMIDEGKYYVAKNQRGHMMVYTYSENVGKTDRTL